MIGKRTEEATAATLAEVKDLLTARSVQPEFGYEQQTSLDYAKKFAKIEKAEADKLVAELMEVDGMKFDCAVKLADIMPASASQVLAIGSKDKVSPSDANLKKVLEIIKSYRK